MKFKMVRSNTGSSAHYEVKFNGPEGIVIDVGNRVGREPVVED